MKVTSAECHERGIVKTLEFKKKVLCVREKDREKKTESFSVASIQHNKQREGSIWAPILSPLNHSISEWLTVPVCTT